MTVLKSNKSKHLKRGDGYYLFEPFNAKDILAGFSTRRWMMKPNTPRQEFSSNDLMEFSSALKVSSDRLVYFHQVHGTQIVTIDESFQRFGIYSSTSELLQADAAVSNLSSVTLAIFTADCAPIFFHDSSSNSIGLAHVGWRGADQGLIRKMMERFQSGSMQGVKNLMIGFGPMIRACCYEVGEEFCERFGSFVLKRNARFYFDLSGFIKNELVRLGVSESQIFDSTFCTVCEQDQFFSHRREGNGAGRICSVVMKR